MKYQRCIRCVMDNNNDPEISFDGQGICSYCTDAFVRKDIVYFPNDEGKARLEVLVLKIKEDGKGKKYDCMMGISGGLDSSYLAMLGKKWGLRILAIHIDDGFDTEVAKENIEKLCKACDIELIIIKPNEEQFNGLTRAFIMAESPNIDTPQDNVLFATLHHYAKTNKIKYFLSGGNFALESILQRSSNTNAYDTRRIKYIHKKFGDTPIRDLSIMSNYGRLIDRYLHKFTIIRPLNLINYNKEKAIQDLHNFCGFNYYDAKHCENHLTKVIQLYWLPLKFQYDKRKSHLSSLIVSGQIDRNAAVMELDRAPNDVPDMEQTLNFVLSKLRIKREVFDEIINKGGKLFSKAKTSWGYGVAHKYFRLFFVKFKA